VLRITPPRPEPVPAYEACHSNFAQRERQAAVAVARQHVEGIELRPITVFAGVKGCEARDAIGVEYDRLAVDHVMLQARLQRGRDDP
jgi:hypothetical protein